MMKVLLLWAVLAVALAEVSREKSECEEHRERESRSNAPLPMRLIPECETNGDYKTLQCFQNSTFCACWDKTGNPVTQPSRKTKACNCVIQKSEVTQRGIRPGTFVPQCEEDGQFKKQQCHGSTGHCWCAHPITGEKTTEPARGLPTCE